MVARKMRAVSCSYKVIKMKANHNSILGLTQKAKAVSCSYKVIKMKANHNSGDDRDIHSRAVSCSYKVIKMKANHNMVIRCICYQELFLVVAKLLK